MLGNAETGSIRTAAAITKIPRTNIFPAFGTTRSTRHVLSARRPPMVWDSGDARAGWGSVTSNTRRRLMEVPAQAVPSEPGQIDGPPMKTDFAHASRKGIQPATHRAPITTATP